VLLALAALGCGSSESSKARAAEASVRQFFTALPTGDCAVLGPLLATGGSARPCPETVEELREHGYELLDVLGAQVDGRDPNAVMVRARIARQGVVREEPLVLRVERQGDAWKLRL
jgi:hypothetical protein